MITGASGNVGREVVKQALALGLKIRATFHSQAVVIRPLRSQPELASQDTGRVTGYSSLIL
jgi:uncharacterized protein YbjT (DUF2867 family)